ncbi:MAG: holo-ACP synthase [Sterolibacterium sp.]|nr:holo-ACP synthase [Sterolibacterium sp.]
MIHGIGTDIVDVVRLERLLQRYGERVLRRILAPEERAACRESPAPGRFLAKRFAAKEALGKAYGSGVRAPLLLPAIRIVHDALGKPGFEFTGELAAQMNARRLVAHLSLSDEQAQVIAFVILEQR